MNNDYVMSLIDQIYFLKEKNKTKNAIIQILSENKSYFSKLVQQQEFKFAKKVSPKKNISSTKDLITSNRLSVLTRENALDLPPPFSTIYLEEQLCNRKDTTPLNKSKATCNNDKKFHKPNKDLSKGNTNSRQKSQ